MPPNKVADMREKAVSTSYYVVTQNSNHCYITWLTGLHSWTELTTPEYLQGLAFTDQFPILFHGFTVLWISVLCRMPLSELPLISVLGLSTYLGILQSIKEVFYLYPYLRQLCEQSFSCDPFSVFRRTTEYRPKLFHAYESLECTRLTQKGIY